MITRQVEGVAELQEAGRLVGAGRVDGAGQVGRVVGEYADRVALDAGQGGDHAEAEVPAQLEDGPGVEDQVDGPAHVVAAQAVDGHDVAQPILVGARPVVDGPLEVRQVALGQLHGFGLVGGDEVDDPVGPLHVDRPDGGRREHPQPAALDHRRPAHPDVRVGGGDHDVAAPEDGGVAGEAVAGVDADQWHEARQLGPPQEGEAVEARRPHPVGVAGAPSPTFGEEDDRQAEALGEVEQSVLLAVVLQALGARKHGVVVGHGDAARLAPREQLAVDGPDATDQPVGRGVGDQVVELAPAALGGDDERPVLDERPVVDEVGDVLAGGAPATGATPGDGLRSCRVQADAVALLGLGEVGTLHGRGGVAAADGVRSPLAVAGSRRRRRRP